MEQIFNILITLISFIILLAVVIGFHELGHFLAARRFGVHVIRFKIGFGKTLISKFDKKGTEFSLGLLPLGGYVQMLGEENPLQEEEREENLKSKLISYPEASLGARAIITVAGPAANFLLAIFVYFFVFIIGTKDLLNKLIICNVFFTLKKHRRSKKQKVGDPKENYLFFLLFHPFPVFY